MQCLAWLPPQLSSNLSYTFSSLYHLSHHNLHSFSIQSLGEATTMNLHLLKLQDAAFFLNNHPIVTLFFSLFLSIFIAKTCFFTEVNKKLPPSPPKLPILGHLHLIGLYPHRSLHSMSSRHGPLMLLHLGTSPTLIVSSAAAAKEIMKTHDLIFSNRPESSIAKRLFYDYKDLSTVPYGEYWRQMRSIMVLQLLSSKRVRSFQAVREEETSLMINKIIQLSQRSHDSSVVNLSDMFVLLTNDVICRVAFGRKYSEGREGRKFEKLLDEFIQLLGVFDFGDFVPWLSWLKYVTGLHQRVEKVFQEFDRFLGSVIDDHLTQTRSNGMEMEMDFVDVLLKVQEDSSQGFSLTMDHIKALLLDTFAAGTDTTFTALEWTMTEIMRHPDVLKKAQKEIRGIVGPKQTMTEGDIEKMHYFKAVIKESLRMHPPIPLLVPRQSSKDVNINGFDIAAGTRVIINSWTIGRDPETWDQPDKFRPERFMGSDVDFKGQDFELIPFGAGRRGCPGTVFATATIEFALASLLHKLDWALPPGEDFDMSESAGLSIKKNVPLRAVPIIPAI